MTRTQLLGAVSAAALSCLSVGANAQSVINGGGSTLAQFDYGLGAPNATPAGEFGLFNSSSPAPAATIGTYWEAGSGTGQLALLNDDLTCDITKALTGTATCAGVPGGANTVHYGASDATLSSTQIAGWATSSVGQSAAGDLIQLPSMGVAVAIPVVDAKFTKNYQITLDDNDLCGVFSGKITNFNQLSDFTKSKITAGAFNVVYRSDSSGTTFLLTNHLADANVCNSSNTASGFTFFATTTFATLFTTNGIAMPTTFIGESGSSKVQAELLTLTAALGYLTPDYTSVDSSAKLNVAAVASGAVEKGEPTVAEIIDALAAPVDGSNLTPPASQAQAQNPSAWVPLVQTVKKGYPIVGYTTFDFAQCYADPNVQASVIAFLNDHYTNSSYTKIQNSNGFVALTKSAAAKFLTAITNDILTNTNKYNTNFGNVTVCAGLAGR
jgi:ABC-type phosphate transport system substrate-binding protein